MSGEQKDGWLKWGAEKVHESREMVNQQAWGEKVNSTVNWSKEKASQLPTLDHVYNGTQSTFDRTKQLVKDHPHLAEKLMSGSVFAAKQCDKMTELYKHNPDFYNGVAATLLVIYALPYVVPGVALGAGKVCAASTQRVNFKDLSTH